MASEKRLRDALVSEDLYFDAAQPRSPPCWGIGMFKNPQPIKETKTWMVLGGADDYTLAKHCEEIRKKYKINGADIEVTVKKKWGHGFTANYEAEYEKDPQIFNDCPGYFTGDDGTTSSSDPDYKWATECWKDPCVTKGAHIGGNKGGIFKKPFLKFFKENLLN